MLIPQIFEEKLERFLGFDKLKEMDSEPEHTDCLCWVDGKYNDQKKTSEWFSSQDDLKYKHQPNRLSPEHVDWEIIDRVRKSKPAEQTCPLSSMPWNACSL